MSSSIASNLNDNYKEALNLVRQAYLREWNDLQSATTLAMGDKTAIADIQAYGAPPRARSRTADRDGAAGVSRGRRAC